MNALKPNDPAEMAAVSIPSAAVFPDLEDCRSKRTTFKQRSAREWLMTLMPYRDASYVRSFTELAITAVPLVITPTRLPREVKSDASEGSASMSRQGYATPGE